jgi:hypothetical protein
MREVVYKNLTSIASRKKDIFLREVFEKNGIVAKTERRCFYFIKDIIQMQTEDDFKKWISEQGPQSSKRHFHIFKVQNDLLGENKLICKIAGTFYAVAEKTVYTIAFLHSFKVSFNKAATLT